MLGLKLNHFSRRDHWLNFWGFWGHIYMSYGTGSSSVQVNVCHILWQAFEILISKVYRLCITCFNIFMIGKGPTLRQLMRSGKKLHWCQIPRVGDGQPWRHYHDVTSHEHHSVWKGYNYLTMLNYRSKIRNYLLKIVAGFDHGLPCRGKHMARGTQ